MSPRLPKTILIGLAAAGSTTLLWIVEQITDSLIFEFFTIPVKLALLVAFPMFLPDLSSFLHRRGLVAIALVLFGVVFSIGAATLYLPWRNDVGRRFSNEVYSWYYMPPSPENQPSHFSDFEQWVAEWHAHLPHYLETGILVVFYTVVMGVCYFFRLSSAAGMKLGILMYVYLFLVPLTTGLLVWSNDFYLKGIAFDSIAMDLVPFAVWKGWDSSIFLYVFMLIFFVISAFFFCVAPREHAQPANAADS